MQSASVMWEIMKESRKKLQMLMSSRNTSRYFKINFQSCILLFHTQYLDVGLGWGFLHKPPTAFTVFSSQTLYVKDKLYFSMTVPTTLTDHQGMEFKLGSSLHFPVYLVAVYTHHCFLFHNIAKFSLSHYTLLKC